MFACDQPVILPHVTRQKCTCMDCNAMCPKINQTKVTQLITMNSTWTEKIKASVGHLPLTTRAAIGIYIIFVILIILVNIILNLCNVRNQRKKEHFVQSKNNDQ